MDIEIGDLRVLRSIAEAGSVAGAARLLNLDQGNVSRRLRRIERAAGLTLFHRHSTGSTPTGAGHIVLRATETALPLVDGLLAAADRSAHSTTAVRLGSVPTSVLPVLARTVGELMPGAEVSARPAEDNRVLLDELRTGRLDLAVLRDCPVLGAPLPAGLATAVLAEEALLVLLPARHRLAGADPVHMADLAGETCLLPESRDSVLRRHFLAVCAHTGTTVRMSCAPDESTATALVCATGGLAPGYPTPPPTPGVAHRPLADGAAGSRLTLTWLADNPAARRATAIADATRHAYATARTDRGRHTTPHAGSATVAVAPATPHADLRP